VNAYRTKLLLCALLAIPLLTAGAQRIQRIHRPALGNEILAKQHSAKFLAERGVYARLPGGSSPAEVLAQSRARYRQQVQQLVASGVSVPAWQPLGPAQVSTPAYGAVTGRVTSIAADSSDPTGNTIYVGTASGGVWKSTSAAGDPASVSLVPLTDYV
jgi:Mrp family chromosome partitioning ATPase